jgi:tetratricopeptide (TPR) repeat protein
MIDFDLQVHGIAQTVAALAALALAVWSRATPPSHLVDRPVGPWSRLALTALATGLVFGLWCGLAEPAARAADEVQRAQDALSEAQVLMREAASPRRMLPEADRESVLRRATDRVISALRHLQRAVQLDPRHDEALAMLADCHLRLHLEGQAVDPADGAPHLSKAMRYASLARAANPGRSSHFLRLGRLFFETWRVTGWPDTVHKAYDSIRRAVSLFPSLPMAHVEFADACERMNSPAEALEHYREALRLDKMQYHDTRRRLTQEQRDRVERRVAAWEKALRMYRPQ